MKNFNVLAVDEQIGVCGVIFNVFCEKQDIDRLEFPVSINAKRSTGAGFFHVGNYRLGTWDEGIKSVLRSRHISEEKIHNGILKLGNLENLIRKFPIKLIPIYEE